jgi:hypothetical protein
MDSTVLQPIMKDSLVLPDLSWIFWMLEFQPSYRLFW